MTWAGTSCATRRKAIFIPHHFLFMFQTKSTLGQSGVLWRHPHDAHVRYQEPQEAGWKGLEYALVFVFW